MSPEADYRTELATWMTSGDNSYFSRAIVNRVWSHLLGRGLVEPVDDPRITNPATHPALLDWLTQDFVDRGFQLRHVIRCVCQSDVDVRGTAKDSGHHATVEFYTDLDVQLQLLNGAVLNDRLSADDSTLMNAVNSGQSAETLINDFYLRALSRTPREAEMTFWKDQFPKDVSSTGFAAVAQDFVWSLLNSNEFCTNHSTTSGPLRCVR